MGQLSLRQVMAFLPHADGFIASGTGPLHIAAALGIRTLGIYPPKPDIDPLRWAPIGRRAEYLCLQSCKLAASRPCSDTELGPPCACTSAIGADQIAARIQGWIAGEPRMQHSSCAAA
jgi:ADP-heptose:LPS heptosyltransferase